MHLHVPLFRQRHRNFEPTWFTRTCRFSYIGPLFAVPNLRFVTFSIEKCSKQTTNFIPTDDFGDDLKMTTFNSIIPIITFVANTSIGYNLIWNLFTRNEMQPLFEAIVFGLQTKDSSNSKHLTSDRQN